MQKFNKISVLFFLMSLLAQALFADPVEYDEREKKVIEKYSIGGDTLTFYVDGNTRPYAFLENGDYKGILVDVLNLVMQQNGMAYKMAKIKSHEGLAKAPTLLTLDLAVVKRKDFQGDEKKVAVMKTMLEFLDFDSGLDDEDVVFFNSPKQVVNAVKAKDVDAAYLLYPLAAHFVDTDFSKTLVVKRNPKAKFLLSPYLPKSELDDVASILSKSRASVSPKAIEAVSHQFGWYFINEMPLWDYFRYHPMYIVVTFVLFAIVFFTVGFVFLDNRLKRAQLARSAQEQEILKKQRNEASAASVAKSRFLSNVSADIRAPLIAILGCAGRIEKNLDNKEDVQNSVRKCKTLCDFLLQLVDDVLDVAHLEFDNIVLNEERNDIVALSEDLCGALEQEVQDKNIDFSSDFSCVDCRFAIFDEARVKQIVTNVLTGAIKYTPRNGSLKFTIEEDPCDNGDYVQYCLCFEGSGEGLSSVEATSILQETVHDKSFFYARIDGRAIGLAIVKRIVDLMGGEIEYSNNSGSGITLKIRLKFLRAHAESEGYVGFGTAPEWSEDSLKGTRVLLVENSEFNREIAVDLFHDLGLEVDIVEDGQQAIDQVKLNGSHYYDCVFMDVQIPVVDGYEATRQIHAMYPDENLPIVAISSNSFKVDRQKSLAAGMVDYLSKPFTPPRVINVLRKIMESNDRV